MFQQWSRPARNAFPWGTTGLCLLLCGAACAAYRYWRVDPNPANSSEKRTSVSTTIASSRSAKVPDAPPMELAILIFKSEKRMEVWRHRQDHCEKLRDYSILAASGSAGPKLREGDRQVPEGVYGIAETNPRSRF